VERGRTVPNWRPRRLGGGLGSSRISGGDAEKKDSTRYTHCSFSILIISFKAVAFSYDVLKCGTRFDLSIGLHVLLDMR
jgi:hypothetical protein